jgi:hypothetical protein
MPQSGGNQGAAGNAALDPTLFEESCTPEILGEF